MPSKKKGKGSKFARMSDEERARYLQHRAELELEAKRRKQQLIAIFTKNKLKREEAFSRLNTAKINEQWRYVLRKIKCKELHESVRYSWENFVSVAKRKDATIKRLYERLTVAHADHKILQDSHVKMIDDVIGRHGRNGAQMCDGYRSKLNKIVSEDMVELNRLRKGITENRKVLEAIVANQELTLEDRLTKTKTRNAVNMQTIIYSKENVVSLLIEQSSAKMEKLRKELNDIASEYETGTEYKRKQYALLKKEDDICQAAVESFPRIRGELQRTMEDLKSNLDTLCADRNTCIARLNCQEERAKDMIAKIRTDMLEAEAINRSRLRVLSVASKDVVTVRDDKAFLQNLQKMLEKGSTLLLLSQMCSRLEPLSLTIKMYCFQEDQAAEATSENYIFSFFNKLDKFWKRYSYAKAVNIRIRKERSDMSLENKRLRQSFKTYLLSISTKPTVKPSSEIFAR